MPEAPQSMTQTPNFSGSSLIEDVLARVRVASAVYLRGDFTAPWAVTSTDRAALAQIVAPGAKRLIVFHLAVEGGFWITLPTGESARIKSGEAVILPYCDIHSMGSP